MRSSTCALFVALHICLHAVTDSQELHPPRTSRRKLTQSAASVHPDTKTEDLNKVRHWVTDAPHPPGADLANALQAAAFRPPNFSSKGIVIVNSGSKYAFDELLPRWLASMSPTLDGDIAQHTIILTLGYTAHELCRAEQQSFKHQCVLLPHWNGPDRMYHFGDEWYTAVTLSKLELMYNVVSLGYDPVWMDTDMVHVRNPLPHLASLDVDIAVTTERCSETATSAAAGLKGNLLFNLNTGIMRLAANPGVVRFARQWVDVQREKMLEALGGIFDAMDPLHRPHDQVTFHQYMLPQLRQDPVTGEQPLLKLGTLDQQFYPNRCGGWCGCDGATSRGPKKLVAHTDSHGHFLSGRIQCPDEVWQEWYSYHVPCVKTFHEKVGLLDAYQSALNLLINPSMLGNGSQAKSC